MTDRPVGRTEGRTAGRTAGAVARRGPAAVTALLLALALLLAGAGCASIPTSGPVVRAQVPDPVGAEGASDIDAVPPRPGEPATDVAEGFLDAMQASPIRLDVARRYLTASAASTWSPMRSTITYGSKLPPRIEGSGRVAIALLNADRLDSSGAWRGAIPPQRSRLRLHLVRVDGQYRITDPPDALVVPQSWFTPRFRQVSVYFFDPSGRILVPQPVFVPRGDQFASALVAALIDGPGRSLRGVARTFLPHDLTPGLSVPVDDQGVARVDLGGDISRLSPAAAGPALAQLAWTLRQDPDIRAIRLSIGGTHLLQPDGGESYPVDAAAAYDPDGYRASTLAYGISDGRLVSVDGRSVARVPGPLDEVHRSLRSLAVSVDGTRVAAVTASGTRVVLAPLGGAGDEDGAQARTVIRGERGLLRPAWDASGRWWVVGRGPDGGAQVTSVSAGRRQVVDVPGVTGRPVTAFLVSRDGTRLVALEHGRRTDRLVQARIRTASATSRGSSADQPSRVLGVTRATALPLGATGTRIQAMCWTSPVTVAVATASVPGQITEVRTVNLDGSPPSDESLAATVPATVTSLACSPDPTAVPYAVTPSGLIDLSTGGPTTLDQTVGLLGYAG